MNTGKKTKSRQGFTLTEIMVASFILAMGLSGFGLGALQAMRTNRLAKHHYQGTCLVRNRIQRARAISFDSIPLLEENFLVIDRDGNLNPDGRFRRTTEVMATGSNAYEIVVSVFYPDSRNQPVVEVPIQMRSIISRLMTE